MPDAPRPGAGGASAAGAARIPAEIWILLVATFFVAIGFGLIVPVLPQYAASFGVSAFLATIVVSAFAFMRLVGAPFAGWSVNRFGEQRMYVAGLLIVAASSLASAFAADYAQLLIVRGLGGVGSVLFTVSASGLVIRFAPPAIRGRVSALWGGTFLVGNIAGPALGGLLGQLGMRVPFIAYSIALAIAAAIVAVVLHRPARRQEARRSASGEAAASAPASAPPLRVRDVAGDSAYRAALVSGFAAGWGNFGVRSAVVPLFIAALVSQEPWAVGVAIAVSALGNMLALRFAGPGSDRRGRRPYLIAGFLISALSLVAMPFARELWLVLAIGFIGGAGAGLAAPAQQAAIADLVGRGRSGGQVISTAQMAQDLGTIIGPVVAGLIIDGPGFGWAFGSAAVVLAAGALAWRAAREPRASADPAPS